MLLYDVFYHTPQGRRLAGFDSSTSSPRIQKGVFTQWVNKNWDGEVTWFDSMGREVSYDSLPWVVAERLAAKERELERLHAEHVAEREFEARIAAGVCAIERGVRIHLQGAPERVVLRVSTYQGPTRDLLPASARPLEVWRKTAEGWADLDPQADFAAFVYQTVGRLVKRTPR